VEELYQVNPLALTWEYKVETLGYEVDGDVAARLELWGQDRWELVAVVPNGNGAWVFKRPRQSV
jgi:hypothetical protein